MAIHHITQSQDFFICIYLLTLMFLLLSSSDIHRILRNRPHIEGNRGNSNGAVPTKSANLTAANCGNYDLLTIFYEIVHVTTPVLLFGLHYVTPRRGRVSVCLPSLD